MLAGGGHGLNCRVYTSAGDTCNQSVGGWWMAAADTCTLCHAG